MGVCTRAFVVGVSDAEVPVRYDALHFTELFGLRLDTLTPEEVTASLTVDPSRHLHPWGAVHGGVYCTVSETLATLGAQLSAIPAGKLASGIENHTSFLRQVIWSAKRIQLATRTRAPPAR